jgi:Predicted membrane protein
MTPDNQTVTIEFKGTGLEYFKIWIVNLILSILTIGIYSAWATVRKKRYMYGSTLLDGSSFEYHASPITILKGRLIAVALFVIYTVVSQVSPEAAIIFLPVLVIVSPWIIWRSIKFNAKISSFRNVYFGFEGALGKSYLYYLVIPFLLPFLLIPLVGSSILTIFSGNFEESFLIMFGVGYLVFILIIPFIKK